MKEPDRICSFHGGPPIPAEEFRRTIRTKSGRHNICTVCMKQQEQERRDIRASERQGSTVDLEIQRVLNSVWAER